MRRCGHLAAPRVALYSLVLHSDEVRGGVGLEGVHIRKGQHAVGVGVRAFQGGDLLGGGREVAVVAGKVRRGPVAIERHDVFVRRPILLLEAAGVHDAAIFCVGIVVRLLVAGW